MTAKEMFEKLGYTRKLDSEKLIYTKYLNCRFILCESEITFVLTEKEVELSDFYADFTKAYMINNALLKAIYKQAEELGWLSVTI